MLRKWKENIKVGRVRAQVSIKDCCGGKDTGEEEKNN